MTDRYNRVDRRTRQVLELDYRSYREDFDPLTEFFNSAIHIARTARAIQAKDAISYRDFLVGSCALMNNVQDGILRAYVGFNNTPEEEAPKHCAEMKAIGRGIHDGFTQCEAIAIVGTTNVNKIEGVNHERTPTLQPCDVCLKIIDESAVVVSIGEDQDIYEANTCSQIIGRRYAQAHAERRTRRRGEAASPIQLIKDPGFLHWAGGCAMYEEQAQSIELGPNNGLRLERAQIAVAVLRAA